MLFQSTQKFDIIHDADFAKEMPVIEAELEKYVNRGYFPSFDGADLFYEFFKCAQPRASIVIVHGFTEFIKKYYELCWYFLNMGYNVFMFDLRGRGYSHRDIEDTEITHVDSFFDYVKDLECFMNQIVTPNSDDAPAFIYSHSMGGAISALYLAHCKNNVSKTILSSPMVYPVCTPLPHQVLRLLMRSEAKRFGWNAKFRFSSDFDPDFKLENSMDLSKCRFQYNLDMRIRDMKYRNSSSSNRWNFEVLGVVDMLLDRKAMRNVSSETFIISAGKDTVVKNKPQLRLAKLLNSKYQCFENAKHSMFTMPDNDLAEYINTLLDFYACN